MNVLVLIASLVLVGGVDATVPMQPNNNRDRFIISHVPGDELKNQKLFKCEYGDGSTCLFMNRDRMTQPVTLKFRIDNNNANLEGVVQEAEYVSWIQRNDNACRFAEGDASVHLLGKTPFHASDRKVYANARGVVFDAHRIEMSSNLIMRLTEEAPMALTAWQICVGIDPKHGQLIESDKHPVGGLVFNIGTQLPKSPRLAGVKSLHEKMVATVLLPQEMRTSIRAVGLRAIPTRLASRTPAPDYDVTNDPNQQAPVPGFACPDWSDYHGMAVGTDLGQEINPGAGLNEQFIDREDAQMHLPITLRTIPDEEYVVCAYARDRVNNVSPFSEPRLARSHRESDLFSAFPQDFMLNTGHGCAQAGPGPWGMLAAACTWVAARARRRHRQTRP